VLFYPFCLLLFSILLFNIYFMFKNIFLLCYVFFFTIFVVIYLFCLFILFICSVCFCYLCSVWLFVLFVYGCFFYVC